MSPIKSLLRPTEAMIPCSLVFLMDLFRLHESRLSVIADIGNEAWGRSTRYNTCPGQPRFPYYHPHHYTRTRLPTTSSPHDHLTKIQNQEFRVRAKGLPIAQKDNPAVKIIILEDGLR